jgi:hypothetical protein
VKRREFITLLVGAAAVWPAFRNDEPPYGFNAEGTEQ